MLSEHKLPEEIPQGTHASRAEELGELKRSISGSFNSLTRNLGLCNGFPKPQLLQTELFSNLSDSLHDHRWPHGEAK